MKITSSKTGIDFAKKETAFLTLSVDQTTGLTPGSPVLFAQVEGDLPLASSRITLKANVKYKLDASVRIGGSNGLLDFIWYDVTNSANIGQYARTFSANNSSTDASFPTASAVVTPTTDIEVEVRILVVSNVTAIYFAYTSAYIEAVEAYIPINNPMSYIHVSRDTAQAIPTSTQTTILFDFNITDALGEYNTTNGRFTAKYSGVYSFSWSALSASASWSNGQYWETRLAVNGSSRCMGFRNIIPSTQIQLLATNGSCQLKLNAGDYIEIQVWHNLGSTLNLHTSGYDNFLTVARIR